MCLEADMSFYDTESVHIFLVYVYLYGGELTFGVLPKFICRITLPATSVIIEFYMIVYLTGLCFYMCIYCMIKQ